MSLDFLKCLNWQLVVNAITRLGNQANKPSYRFLKGHLVCDGICHASRGRLVFADEKGYDLLDTHTNLKFEVRSQHATICTKDQTRTRRGIPLKNIYGQSGLSHFHKTFDYLLIVQSNPRKFRVVAISWDQCHQSAYHNGDQIKLKSTCISHRICNPDQVEYQALPQITVNYSNILRPFFEQ